MEGFFPRDLRILKREKKIITPILIESELYWAANLCCAYKEQLAEYLAAASSFERALISGDNQRAEQELKGIEESLGCSLWLIEQRLAFLQVTRGLEAQKQYQATVRQACGDKHLLSFLTFHASRRNEANINVFLETQRFTENSATWGLNEGFRKYLLYRVTDSWESTEIAVSAIIRNEYTSGIIDLYETFLRLASKAIIEKVSIGNYFIRPLELLWSEIKDERIERALLIAGARHELAATRYPFTQAREHFARGNFEATVSEIVAHERKEPPDIKTPLLYAEASAELGDELAAPLLGFSKEIADAALQLIVKMPDKVPQDSFISLMRIASNFRFAAFSAPIVEFAWRQLSSDPLPSRYRSLLSFISSPWNDLSSTRFLPNEHQQALLKDCNSSNPWVLFQCAFSADEQSTDISGLSETAQYLIRIERAISSGDFSQSLTLCREWRSKTKRAHNIRQSLRYEANSLLSLGRLEEVTDLIVSSYLEDNNVISFLPIRQTVSKLHDKAERRKFSHKISLPIIVDLNTRFYSPDLKPRLRAHTYDDFLLANNVRKPTELRAVEEKFNRTALVYYLRYICVPEVMQRSMAFDGSQAVEEERLEVCRILTELDPANAAEYTTEIADINRRQVIEGGVRLAEQSKISIDPEPLKRWAEQNLRESYARLQALRQTGMGSASLFSSLDEDTASSAKGGGELPTIPRDEANDLFIVILSTLTREWLSNSRHGLDCYLSMRIRHGALAGQMRAPLESEHLLTQKDKESGEYSRNEFWLQRLNGLDSYQSMELDDRLRQFSADYDSLIEDFAQEYIQVYGTDKKKGLFRLIIPEIRLISLFGEISSETSFDRFLDVCYSIFLENVDACLLSVRNHIESVLKPQVYRLFNSLQADVEKALGDHSAQILLNAIRGAQTAAQNSLETLKSWFLQAKPVPQREFSLRDLMEITVRQIKKSHQDFDPQITWDVPDLVFSQFNRFSDMFFVIFGNIQRHSGLQAPHVGVSARLDEDKNQLKVEIKSEVAVGIWSRPSEVRLESIRQTLATDAYQRTVSKEGASGLFKLANLIRLEGERKDYSFGFESESEFLVSFTLPVRTFAAAGDKE